MAYEGTREHNSWRGMRERCYNRNHSAYKNYGGRGIKICQRWKNSFLEFYADMGKCPDGMTIERIDNDGDYEPSNCKWATRKEQSRNRRNWIALLTYNGRTQHLVDWAKELGIIPSALHNRIHKYNWSLERALSTTKSHRWSRR